MFAWKKKTVALSIEYHWWRIRCLRRREQMTPEAVRRIELHRYQADRQAELYEILAGLRNLDGTLV